MKTRENLLWEIITEGRGARDPCKIASLCAEFWWVCAQELEEK